MEVIALLKELLNYREVVGLFAFSLVVLVLMFKEIKTPCKVLRMVLGVFVIISLFIEGFLK